MTSNLFLRLRHNHPVRLVILNLFDFNGLGKLSESGVIEIGPQTDMLSRQFKPRSLSENLIWLRAALFPPGGIRLYRRYNQHRLLRRLCQAKKLLALGPTTEFSDRLQRRHMKSCSAAISQRCGFEGDTA